MRAGVLLAAAAAPRAAAARGAAGDHDAARAAAAARINAVPGVTWTAGAVARFRGLPVGASRPLLGVKAGSAAALDAAVQAGEVARVGAPAGFAAPDRFDAAESWPQCASVIGDIRDQSNCGCCWAFGAAEAASDRMCIATNGSVAVPLSAQDLCFCANPNGCAGGYLNAAWDYIKVHGLVSGSQQQPGDGSSDPFKGTGLCSSFSLPHCHHHGPQGSDPYPAEGAAGCPKQDSPACPTKCDAGAAAPHDDFESDKYIFTGQVETYSGEAAMQAAIMAHGPIEAAFTVYDDFENYVSGVYQKTSDTSLGGHAIRIVGWGVDAAVKYWKVANSWDKYWGEDGHFRIRRGTNECGIEGQTAANSGDGQWVHGKPPPAPPSCCSTKGTSLCMQFGMSCCCDTNGTHCIHNSTCCPGDCGGGGAPAGGIFIA